MKCLIILPDMLRAMITTQVLLQESKSCTIKSFFIFRINLSSRHLYSLFVLWNTKTNIISISIIDIISILWYKVKRNQSANKWYAYASKYSHYMKRYHFNPAHIKYWRNGSLCWHKTILLSSTKENLKYVKSVSMILPYAYVLLLSARWAVK